MYLQIIGDFMVEEIEIQTVSDVRNIDYMRSNNDFVEQVVTEQINQTDTISETLTNIQDTIANQTQVDLSEVTDLIENIDTTVVEVQTQDILATVNEQQNKIDEMQSSIDDIHDKLNQILEKL